MTRYYYYVLEGPSNTFSGVFSGDYEKPPVAEILGDKVMDYRLTQCIEVTKGQADRLKEFWEKKLEYAEKRQNNGDT